MLAMSCSVMEAHHRRLQSIFHSRGMSRTGKSRGTESRFRLLGAVGRGEGDTGFSFRMKKVFQNGIEVIATPLCE